MIKWTFLFLLPLFVLHSCESSGQGSAGQELVPTQRTMAEEGENITYEIFNVHPEWSLELDEEIRETSGLILWDGSLWTMNDDTDTRLYELNAGDATITGSFRLQGVTNQDWEGLAQDRDYIYVGDFGNNRGDRRNLHILRVKKEGLRSGNPEIDTIWFSYSDQRDFSSPGLNQTEFDCEAFIAGPESIYLFTKQWVSGNTTLYRIPKYPGTHVARKEGVYPIRGQVTGASYVEQDGLLVLCGYSGNIQPFLHLFYAYRDHAFFSGKSRRINISLPFYQVEGIATEDGLHYYISNESFSRDSKVVIPQKLHLINLSEALVSVQGGRDDSLSGPATDNDKVEERFRNDRVAIKKSQKKM